jgi:hypothetical protein
LDEQTDPADAEKQEFRKNPIPSGANATWGFTEESGGQFTEKKTRYVGPKKRGKDRALASG